jgi:hypothetical protein
MISDAEAPAVVRSLPTLITLRSIFCSIVERSATTLTPFSCVASSSRETFTVADFLLSLKITDPIYFLNPMY